MKRKIIYGPPGTGKSTEIIRRLNDYLKKGYQANDIALCSYTKAAAQVLADKSGLKSRYVGTIHSLAFRQAGCMYEQTVNYSKLKEFEKLSGIRITGANPDEAEYELSDGDHYLALYALYKATCASNHLDTYDASKQPGTREDFDYFVQAYEHWKKATGYVDFNDMIDLALKEPVIPVKILFIDEAQDLSELQWRLVKHWNKSIAIIEVAGDDDQAIYEWAGAKLNGMSVFEKEVNADRYVLGQSYRVPRFVHTIANSIINSVEKRVEKKYNPRDSEGEVHSYPSVEYVRGIKHGDDVLVLYRNHSLRKQIEIELIFSGIPYTVDNGKPGACQGNYMKQLQLFREVQHKGVDNVTLNGKQVKLLREGIHEKYIHKLGTVHASDIFNKDWSEVLDIHPDMIPYYTEIEKIDRDFKVVPTVHLSTIHGAKGKEADRVVLINGMGAKNAERFYSGDTDTEARVFYVAVTRTRDRLDIVQHDNPVYWL